MSETTRTVTDINNWNNKYRPTKFEEVIGNHRTVASLAKLSGNDVLQQLTLLVGDIGTGKLSLAGIMAKELLCNNKQPYTSIPTILEDVNANTDTPSDYGKHACEECLFCRETNQHVIGLTSNTKGVWLYSFNKSNNRGGYRNKNAETPNGNPELKDIIAKIKERPRHPYKRTIIIINNMHNISPEGQDSLLKDLEDTPEGIYILATSTSTSALRPAILSRAQVYRTRKSPEIEIINKLIHIAELEGVRYSDSALKNVVMRSQYNPRASVDLFQKVADTGDVTVQGVLDMLDSGGESAYLKFFESALGRPEDSFKIVQNLVNPNDNPNNNEPRPELTPEGLLRVTLDLHNLKFGIDMGNYLTKTAEQYYAVHSKIGYNQLTDILQWVIKAVQKQHEGYSMEAILKGIALKIGRGNVLQKAFADTNMLLTREKNTSYKAYSQRQIESRSTAPKDSFIENLEDIMELGKVSKVTDPSKIKSDFDNLDTEGLVIDTPNSEQVRRENIG